MPDAASPRRTVTTLGREHVVGGVLAAAPSVRPCPARGNKFSEGWRMVVRMSIVLPAPPATAPFGCLATVCLGAADGNAVIKKVRRWPLEHPSPPPCPVRGLGCRWGGAGGVAVRTLYLVTNTTRGRDKGEIRELNFKVFFPLVARRKGQVARKLHPIPSCFTKMSEGDHDPQASRLTLGFATSFRTPNNSSSTRPAFSLANPIKNSGTFSPNGLVGQR